MTQSYALFPYKNIASYNAVFGKMSVYYYAISIEFIYICPPL